LGEEPREGFSLVLIGQKRNGIHGIQGKNGATHSRWKKGPLLVTKNDDLSSNLMDDGSRLDDEEREI